MPLSLSELLNPAPTSWNPSPGKDEAGIQRDATNLNLSPTDLSIPRQSPLGAQGPLPSHKETFNAVQRATAGQFSDQSTTQLTSDAVTLQRESASDQSPNMTVNMATPSSLEEHKSASSQLSADIQPDVVDAPIQDSMGFGTKLELAQIAEQATETIARGDSLMADGSQEGAQPQTTGLHGSAEPAASLKPKPKKSTTKDEGMHSDKRYLCYLCNKLFTRRRSVRDHISKIHNIKTWDPTRSLEIIVDPTTGECVEPLEEQIEKAGQVPADVTPPPPLPAPPPKVVHVKTEPSLAGSRASSIDRSVAPSTSTPTAPAPIIGKKRPASATKDKKGMARIKNASAVSSAPNKKIKLSDSESITGLTTRSPSATPASIRTKTPLSKLARQTSQSVASSPTPSSRSRSASVMPSEGGNDASTPGTNDDGEIFCICRKGDNHTWMIACDGGCDEWYHGNCVNIRERDGDLIDKYICPRCTRSDYTTTWKRMCRRKACRKPARVLDLPPSKYCSPECGRKFFVEMVQRSDPNAKASNNGQYILESVPVKKLRKKMRKRNLLKGGISLKEMHDNMDGVLSREETPMLDSPHKQEEQSEYETDSSLDDDQLPNRGCALRAGEVKAIVERKKTIDEWRALGTRPVDPPGNVEGVAKIELNESEKESQATISKLMSTCRERISVLECREQLLEMIKTRSAGIVEDVRKADKKNKELCGFDPRLCWTEEEFLLWRDSEEGKSAVAVNRIGQPPEADDGNASDSDDSEDVLPTKGGVCIKNRCQRHRTWQKSQLAEIRFEQDLVRKKIEKLEREEADVKGRAVLRAWERWED